MKNHAFTLIEVLIVVLIIGILAALAVPKYQRAVDKAKVVQLQTYIHSVIKAQNLYYLANGSYAYAYDQLDLDVTSGPCRRSGASNILNCKGGVVDIRNTDKVAEAAAAVFRFCPTLSAPDYNTCNTNKVFETIYRFPYATGSSGQKNDTWVCNVFSERGKPLKNIFCP